MLNFSLCLLAAAAWLASPAPTGADDAEAAPASAGFRPAAINTLDLAEAIAGIPIYTAVRDGLLEGANIEDDWLFNAETGDKFSIRVEGANPAMRIYVRLRDTAGNTLATVNGAAGAPVLIDNHVFAVPGSYHVRILSPDGGPAYALRAILSRSGIENEREANNRTADANRLQSSSPGLGVFTFAVAGALDNGDHADYFNLGALDAGVRIDATVTTPDDGLLGPADFAFLLHAPNAVEHSASGPHPFGHDTTSAGQHVLAVTTINKAGYALDFDGVDDIAVIPHAAELSLTQFTVELWVYLRQTKSDWQPLILKSDNTGADRNYGIFIRPNTTTIHYSYQDTGGTYRSYDSSTNALTLHRWHHLAMTFDGTVFRLYIDGKQNQTANITSTPRQNTQPVKLGREISAYLPFAGKMDKVRIWNRARSAAEIAAAWNRADLAEGDSVGLAGFWRCNAISSTLTDSGPHGLHGTLGLVEEVEDAPGHSESFAPVDQARGLDAFYIAEFTVSDDVPPEVTATSLPDEGAATTAIINSFSLTFSEDLAPASVNATANYELRWAGRDGIFDTPDDHLYPLVAPAYGNGLTATYNLASGPLQPGENRLTVTGGVTDLAQNPIAPDWVRTFTIGMVDDYMPETVGNNTAAGATSLSFDPPGDFDRSFIASLQLTTGSNPSSLEVVDIDGDGHPDVVLAQYGANQVSVYRGLGNGAFAEPVHYPVGVRPLQLKVADLDGDGHPDVAVVCETPNTVSVLRNQGNGTLAAPVAYAVGTNPRALALADLNADGAIDIVTANPGNHTFSVLLNDGEGAFGAATTLSVGGSWGPRGIAIADLNGDGIPDLVMAQHNGNTASIHLGNGDGTFAAATTLASTNNPMSVAIGDVDGDSLPDIALLPYYGDTLHLYRNQGGGAFAAREEWNIGGSHYNNEIRLVDIDLDGHLDVLIARRDHLAVRFNNGAGGFLPPASYAAGSTVHAAAAGDFNVDGRPDLVAVSWDNHRLTVYSGLGWQSLVPDLVDGQHIGIRTATGRGNLVSTADEDFWSFSALAGERVILLMQNPGNPGSSGLQWRIERPDLANLYNYYTASNGIGQTDAVTLPVHGTYYIRVSYNYSYTGEYRFRLIILPGDWPVESEGNNSVGAANSLSLPLAEGIRQGRVTGMLIETDSSGDYYRMLGNLGEGIEIRLTQAWPASSTVETQMTVVNSSNTAVATGLSGARELTHLIGAGQGGAYYVRVTGAPRGMFSQYLLWVELEDTQPPEIRADTLPGEGTLISSIVDRFTLTFSEDMDATTVNNTANYELRHAGPDDLFDTADDTLYAVGLRTAYSSGLTANLWFPDGPPQPGKYRFTVFPNLADLFGSPITEAYVRTYEVAGVDGFPLETRFNDNQGTATPLSFDPPGDFDRSFRSSLQRITGSNPSSLEVVDIDGDGHDDVVLAQYGANQVSVYRGLGDGTFADPVHYPVGVRPLQLKVADLDGDGHPDVAVVCETPNTVNVLYNNGDGTLAEAVSYSVGTNPRALALADLNDDGAIDIVTVNPGNHTYSVLLNAGEGAFGAATTLNVGGSWGPRGIAIADLDGDGVPDLVMAQHNGNTASIHLGNGDGTFAAATTLASTNNPMAVAIGDVDGDGLPDIALLPYYGDTLHLYLNLGDGNFATRWEWNIGGSHYNNEIRLLDIDGDGHLDVLIARRDHMVVRFNNGTTLFLPPASYAAGSTVHAAATGDFDEDGRPDLVAVSWDNHLLTVFSGLGWQALPPDLVDDQDTGIRTATGRGNLLDNNDNDYWSFSARAGEQVMLVTQNPGNPGSSGLRWRIMRPDGAETHNYYSPSNGEGQTAATLPVDGTYTLLITYNYSYTGEYRFRLIIVPAGWQIESEANNSVGAANSPSLPLADGIRSARITGILHSSDSSGDFYRLLGNLGEGIQIRLAQAWPASSTVESQLAVVNSAGSVVASADPGVRQLEHLIGAGQGGAYYVRVTGTPRGMFSQYQLWVELEDLQPPAITADSLPTEDSVISSIFDRFTLSFSEDLEAATVNNTAHYELRHAGPDGEFATEDDELYSVGLRTTYSSGLTANLWFPDGPLQAGAYRFTVFTGLRDLFSVAMAEPYVRHFNVEDVEGFPLETRFNDSLATATPLGSLPPGAFDRSFRPSATRTTGANPSSIEATDIDGHWGPQWHADLVVAEYNANRVSVHIGLGDGSFIEPAYYPVGARPYQLKVADVNNDGFVDVVVVSETPNTVSVLLNRSDGILEAPVAYAVGTNPRALALADLNGDGAVDIVTVNPGNHTYSVLLNQGDGSGTFHPAATLNVGGSWGPRGIATDDVNGDGIPDLVMAQHNGNVASVHLGNGDGSFAAATTLASTNNPMAVAIGDVDGDGLPDIALLPYYGSTLHLYRNLGAGAFAAREEWDIGGTHYNNEIRLLDIDGDGHLDVLIARRDHMAVRFNNGSGGFLPPASYAAGGTVHAAAAGDFDEDGRPDLVAVSWDNNRITTFNGLGWQALAADPVDSEDFAIRSATGRGNLLDTNDNDYWSFSGRAGEQVILVTQNPGNPGSSGLYWRIMRPDGAEAHTYYSPSNGLGQTATTLPLDGTYALRVTYNWSYFNEYRFRLIVVPAGWQIESEGNNSVGAANGLSFTLGDDGIRRATPVTGMIHVSDGGDFFQLGNLGEGIAINLEQAWPDGNAPTTLLAVVNSAGTVVATAAAGERTLSHVVSEGQAGAYYVRVTGADQGLFSQYLLWVELEDRVPPRIVADTLPAEGSAITTIIDRFNLTFSEDMNAASVNTLTNYQLRHAGPDGIFDTFDDENIAITLSPAFSTGLTAQFSISSGALQPGDYRFTAGEDLRDVAGNPMGVAWRRFFTILRLADFTNESEPNDTRATATALIIEDIYPEMTTGSGRGRLLNSSDQDHWSFQATAGTHVMLSTENPGNPGSSGLRYRILNEAGSTLMDNYTASNGSADFTPLLIPADGTYHVLVTYNWSYFNEYQFRLVIVEPGVVIEVEPNNTIGQANTMTLAELEDGTTHGATAAGLVRVVGDLDYFAIGEIPAGSTVFISARVPSGSPFQPIVGVYNAANQYVQEIAGGNPGDRVAQVDIAQTGQYFALIRAAGTTYGILSNYLLDVRVAPTGGLTFPNLVPVALAEINGPYLSGDTFDVSFRIENSGSEGTTGNRWFDRVLLSPTASLANADNLILANVLRDGSLNPGEGYDVAANVRIPDGVQGAYYLGVYADATNQINEFLFEGDNVRFLEDPVAITRRDYPDLLVENLQVADIGGGVFRISWQTANRGAATAATPFADRLRIRRLPQQTIVFDSSYAFAADLAINATQPRSVDFTAPGAGNYVVEVRADAANEVYEYNANGHLVAEQNNLATATFSIIRFHDLVLEVSPAGAGNVSGAGNYADGSVVDIGASADTSVLPYAFSHWEENNLVRSYDADFTVTMTADRTLTAVFSLPLYFIGATVQPAATGSVGGIGYYRHAANATLTANPAPGYLFDHWQEEAAQLGEANPLTFTVAGPRTLSAYFREANPTHEVALLTQPAGIAELAGAGTYPNGTQLTVAAPVSIEQGDKEYLFQRWLLNGQQYASTAPIQHAFTTLDPATMTFTAVYTERALKPRITKVTANRSGIVPRAVDYVLTLDFDRAMDPDVKPLGILLSGDAGSVPTLADSGAWTSATRFVFPPVSFGDDQGGAYVLEVRAAQDTGGRIMDTVQPFTFQVDVVPPPHPAPVLTDKTASSARFAWADYIAPADLSFFRIFFAPAPFSSLAGLEPVSNLGKTVRQTLLTNIELDTTYHMFVAAVDTAGNMQADVASIPFTVASELPDPLVPALRPLTTTSAELDWAFYLAGGGPLGLQGFRIFAAAEDFADVTGMTPIANLPATAAGTALTGLSRDAPLYIAVVAFNRLGAFVAEVATVAWTDPLAGVLDSDFTLDEPDVTIYQPLVVDGGATLTLPPGATLRFAPGASLDVRTGRLHAAGTALDPIHLTAVADSPGGSPARGAWEGVSLGAGASASLLHNVWIRYGRGLTIACNSPDLHAIAAVWNAGAGLTVAPGGNIQLSNAFLAFNETGIALQAGSVAAVTDSVLKNNTVHNAANNGATAHTLGDNWWGSADPGVIAAGFSGVIDAPAPLSTEPILTAACATADGAAVTGLNPLPLRLLSLNAEAYRISQDSTFAGVAFSDIPRAAGAPTLYATHSFNVAFPLTPEAGVKDLFVQFRSFSGVISATLPLTVEYVTAGPVITAFNLHEGDVINRPLQLLATATATLGMNRLRFMVNGQQVFSTPSGNLDRLWDIRGLPQNVYRIRLEAADNAGNLATREFNVTVQPLPPPAPAITSPLPDALLNTPLITISGTAEPGVQVRISRGAAVLGIVTTAANGVFTLPNALLLEGSNLLIATAFDAVGETASSAVNVVLNTRPPSPLHLLQPVYTAGSGLRFIWEFTTGEESRPTRSRLFIHTTDFTNPAQAVFASPLLTDMEFLLTSQLADGQYHAAVVGYDAAGNASALSERVSFSLDRSAPVLGIAFDKSSPVGPGTLAITLTSNEPLQGVPTFSVQVSGMSNPLAIPLAQESPTRFTGLYPINDQTARSGVANFSATTRDLAGNRFTGKPTGPQLVIDITRPTGVITVNPPAPIGTATPVVVEITLTLSKPPAVGETPLLRFFPPAGDTVTLDAEAGFAPFSSDRLVWRGGLPLSADNGNGIGNFTLAVTDAVGNVGTAIPSGRELELFNTALPPPPGRPLNLSATSLKDGLIRIDWHAVELAESYSIYRAAGLAETPPTDLLVTGLTGTTHTDLPPADGIWSYVITASRRGSEGQPSGILPSFSDRTPPPPPENLAVTLGYQGVTIQWDAPSAGEVPYRYHVYRNDTLIATRSLPGTIYHSPPRGLMSYRVASVDLRGNESFSAEVELDMPVGAVNDFRVRAISGNPPVLQWVRSDPVAVGVNIYRNGVLQNTAPITALQYIDGLGIGTAPVEYTARAVNAGGQESTPKTILVHPLAIELAVNPDTADNPRVPLATFFDRLTVNATNQAAGAAPALWIDRMEMERSMPSGNPVAITRDLAWSLGGGASQSTSAVLAAPATFGVSQTATVRFIRQDSEQGNTLTYQRGFTVAAAARPDQTVEISLGSPPLAGGLATFTVTFINRGYVPADFVLFRRNGQDPGDIYLSVQTPESFEVNRAHTVDVPEGTVMRPNGDGVITVAAGGQFSVTFRDVLVPESLGDRGEARFVAVAQPIYHGYGTGTAQVGGPLQGSRLSNLTLSPYYGIADTDKAHYADGDDVVISGQARDRESNEPVADVPLKIGFSSRGYTWFETVQTDADGAFSYLYQPPVGFSGNLKIWAAHPDVYDQLDQVEISYLRLYITPARGDIVMSRSDTLDISLTLINPGDVPLSGFTVTSEAWVVDGEEEIPIAGLSAALRGDPPATLGPRERRRIDLRLTALANVPDDPLLAVRIHSAEGASTLFTGQLSLRPAYAILTVNAPAEGYVDVSTDRGNLVSREVTVINQGLRPLTDVKLHPPTGLGWFQVNLAPGPDGLIDLPDIPVGGTRTFTVVFAPPEDADLGYFSDSLKITGGNAISDFIVNLYARVTTSRLGSVQFYVDNILVDPVPNARVRLRNAALRTEVGPLNTDVFGNLLISDLAEGDWAWQVAAPGHSVESGVLEIVADQTAMQAVRLSRSLVTVTFSVVPKPFTDRYDIIIEQTFETRVPFPVMVMTPPSVDYQNPEPGFETIFRAQIRNEGLVSIFDMDITGTETEYASVTPLITFVPELRAQQSIEVPFRVRFFGTGGAGGNEPGAAGFTPTAGGIGGKISDCVKNVIVPGVMDPDVMKGLAAMANGFGRCADSSLGKVGAAAIIGFSLWQTISSGPLEMLASVIGCITGSLFADTSGSFGGVSGGGPAGKSTPGAMGGFGFNGFGCFMADTGVLLADGTSIPIAGIEPGMRVRTDRFGGTARVSRVVTRASANLYELAFSGPSGTGAGDSIRVTGEHLLWTDHAGWLAVQQLAPGAWLHHADGSLRRIVSLAKLPGESVVHTFEVDADNAFYAGGILVQDLCGGLWQELAGAADRPPPDEPGPAPAAATTSGSDD